jgi:hypothetical protein
VSRELEVLREEYWKARANPIFDNPADYCILLDLIIDRIEVLENKERGGD